MNWQKTLIWVTVYSIAMAFLETAVVVYLREIYYPYGFQFPLVPIDRHIAITEVGREAATLVMMLAVGFLAGKTGIQRFAYFILVFGIWDIFYYVFLKLILGWPESLLTWDILFLIPTTWVGPVIAPVIISILMILLGWFIIRRTERGYPLQIPVLAWVLLIVGSVTVVLAFTWDFTAYLKENNSFHSFWSIPDKSALYESVYEYIPRKFNWFLFVLSLANICAGIGVIFNKSWKAEIAE